MLAVIVAAACATTTHQGPSPRVVATAPFTAADVRFMTGMIGHLPIDQFPVDDEPGCSH